MSETLTASVLPGGVKTTLLLARHGQTDWNLEGRYQGLADVPLNATGIEQARLLAAEMKGLRIDAVYSSTLCRAAETARAITLGRGIAVQPDPRLAEIQLGEWEGMQAKRIAEVYPELHQRWVIDPRPVRPPGGETIREVHDRVVAAVEEMIADHPAGVICIVTHKVALVLIRCHYLGLEVCEQMKATYPNASVERIKITGRPAREGCCSAAWPST